MMPTNRPTEPQLLDIQSEATSFDLLTPFNRVFWSNMDKATVLDAARNFGSQYRVVAHTGLPHNAKIVA